MIPALNGSIRNVKSSILDDTTTYGGAQFPTAPVPNKKYFLLRLGNWSLDSIITGIEIYSGGSPVSGYNVLNPLDYPRWYITLMNDKQELILDNLPLVCLSTLGNLTKTRIYMLENVSFEYSYLSFIGGAMFTATPFIVPLMFTSHKPNE